MLDQTIPVLSLDDFREGGPDEGRFIRGVGEALQDVGFFALTGHGIRPELIERAYGVAWEFFSLPEAVKRRYEHAELKGQRGFTRFGREHAKDHPAPDLKEFWHVGRELSPSHPLLDEYPRNVWPEGVEGFRPVLTRLYQELDRCAARLLEAVSLFLGEPRALVPELARDGNTILRLIHYPPVPEGAHPESMRAAPHEDINLITLLCEATAGGLEVMTREGQWLPVRAVPGQIIVDAGDMLQNLTNGLLRSTTHRVVNPDSSRERRLSMPFFVHPRSEVSLAPLAGCVARTGGEQRYPPTTAGEYLDRRLREIGLA